MPPELAAFEAACTSMLAALDGLVELARRDAHVGALPQRSIEIRTQNLRREVEALYEHTFQGSVADDAVDAAEIEMLGREPLRAEDFDHFPPNFKSEL